MSFENFIIFVSRIIMAETEVAPTRPPELITITVIRARNLVSWINTLPASDKFYHLLKNFEIFLDPDQARQTV